MQQGFGILACLNVPICCWRQSNCLNARNQRPVQVDEHLQGIMALNPTNATQYLKFRSMLKLWVGTPFIFHTLFKEKLTLGSIVEKGDNTICTVHRIADFTNSAALDHTKIQPMNCRVYKMNFWTLLQYACHYTFCNI